ELAEEMENRFGPPPDPARRFVQLMTQKTELRKMRVLGCEANKKSVTLHLRDDTPLDPKKVMDLVRAPKSPYKLTPDMRLTRRFVGDADGLANVETMLGELAKCWRSGE
ncbi:MAG: TRCF domain-containing protein, partial [Polyangiaceae bacterium]